MGVQGIPHTESKRFTWHMVVQGKPDTWEYKVYLTHGSTRYTSHREYKVYLTHGSTRYTWQMAVQGIPDKWQYKVYMTNGSTRYTWVIIWHLLQFGHTRVDRSEVGAAKTAQLKNLLGGQVGSETNVFSLKYWLLSFTWNLADLRRPTRSFCSWLVVQQIFQNPLGL